MKNLYLDILRRREFMLSILSKEILVQNERAILNELCRMAEKRGLLGVEYDGRVSSGYEFETTKEELEGMTTCDWRKFFRTLEGRDKLKLQLVGLYDMMIMASTNSTGTRSILAHIDGSFH